MNDALGSPQSVLVLGGGSDIAAAIVRALVRDRARRVVLAGRKPERFEPLVEELRALGAEAVDLCEFDALVVDEHERVMDQAFDELDDIDLAIVAFGVHGPRGEAQLEHDGALDVVTTNFVGAVSVLLPLARRMVEQGHGAIVVLSSVAGERGRKKNFVYGSSKAGLDAFCEGLAARLAGSGVHLMVVRPGFVRTKLTSGFQAAPLATSAEDVAEATVDGLRRRADVVWVPAAVRWVMSFLRHVPRAVFRRLEI
jgi:decaprenylphospho-beta-D-erythro-pentofuranosid-2-ulose 2-reductase